MGDVSWPAQLGANGWLEDLTDRFTAEERSAFLAAPIAANVYDGKVYGVPFFTDVGLLWYRKDLLSKSGFASPPGTWDELQQMATKVMADSGTRNGHVFTGAVYEGGTVLGTEFIRSAGGNVLDGNEVVITSPEAIRGLTFERELVTSGVSPEAVADFQEDQVSGEFLNGNSVFMRNWPYVFGILSDPEQSDIDPSQVGVTYVPVADSSVPRTNVGGGWNLFINASSQMKEAAWNLVQFIAATPQQKRLSIKGSYLPTRKDLYQDHQIISTLPAVAQAKKEIFETTTPPVSPFYSDISHAMADQFNQSLRGSITPSEAANNIADQIDQIMQKAANQ
jgi:multiple sugar transport system substrate-binding protein